MAGFYDLPAHRSLAAARTAALLDTTRVAAAPSCLLYARPADAPRAVRTVAVLTGGGSGHEPFPAGYLGAGLLDAAVPGALFASPPPAAVAATLAAAAAAAAPGSAGPPTALLAVVLNYAGDRLSFARGAAMYAERCPDGCLPIRTVLVADDVSVPGAESPRGLAAAAVVLKLAGAAAERGDDLAAVFSIARAAADSAATVGAALTPAHLPGGAAAAAAPAGDATALGLGIHNEPAHARLPIAPADGGAYATAVVREVCGRVEEAVREHGLVLGAPAFVVVVNNLGGVSGLAMAALTAAVAGYLFAENDGRGDDEAQPLSRVADDTRVYLCAGSLVTSLDMNGFSVTVIALSEDAEGLLLAPTDAPAWPRVLRVTRQAYRAAAAAPVAAEAPASAAEAGADAEGEEAAAGPAAAARGGGTTRRVIERVAYALAARADSLNALDALVGDGDFGDTVSAGCAAALSAAAAGHFDRCGAAGACAQLAALTAAHTGGASGNLASEFFAAAAAAAAHGGWRGALAAGAAAVAAAGGAAAGDRTAVCALAPAAAAAAAGAARAAVAAEAERAAEATAGIGRARFGRSASVREEELLGTPDPGAVAVAVGLRAFAAAAGGGGDGKD